MAMKNPMVPLWTTPLLIVGLLVAFVGEHVLSFTTWGEKLARIGVFIAVVAMALLVRAWSAGGAERKAAGRLVLLCCGAIAVGLFVAGLTSGLFGEALAVDPLAHPKLLTALRYLWPIAIGLGLVPLILVELTLGMTRAGSDESGGVELQRVRDMATNGLTIALAASFLMVTCHTAEQRDVRKDVSYFKTSSPGSATVAMARSLSEPVTVYLFFPEVSEVADEAEAYFRDLARASGDHLVVERTDRMIAPTLTKELKVSADGTIVLKKGTKNEKITLSTDFAKARREELRELDGKVQKALMKVLRAKRVAYFSVGHGEINDPESAGPNAAPSDSGKSTLMKQLMGLLNYEVKDWDGYGKPVPDDASILFVLAPSNLLGDEELAAIDGYLAGGGSLMLALPPGAPFDLGPLSGRLGVAFDPTPIADTDEHRQVRGNASDNLELVTNQFSSHASVTTLNRVGVRYGVLMVDSGHLVDASFELDEGKMEPPKRTYVVRSMQSSFPDRNDNFLPTDGEKKDRYNLVAAIEDPGAKPAKPKEGQPTDGMRAMVFASGKLFSDAILIDRRLGLNQALVVDAVKWLGGEEEFAGETVSEKDVAIEHTKSEDVVWFYGSLVGGPLVILGFGLGSVMWRRRRASRRS